MDLNSINANINRLLTNIWAVISFLKEFAVNGAKDVSITYINADGSESVKTFPNVAKMVSTMNMTNDNGVIKDLNGNLVTKQLLGINTILLNANGNMALSVTATDDETVWGLELSDFTIPKNANYVRFTVHGATRRTTINGSIKLPIYFDGDLDTLYIHDEDHYLNSFSRMTQWEITPSSTDRQTSFKIGVDGYSGTEIIYFVSVQAEFFRI